VPSCNPWSYSRYEGNERRTADFADNTNKEGIAVPGVFTRQLAAKEVLDHDEARSHPVIREELAEMVHRCFNVKAARQGFKTNSSGA